MNADLRATLAEMMRSGARGNPAMNALIDDYTEYHVVLVVAGAVAVVAFLLLSAFFWTRWARAARTDRRGWTFARTTHFAFGVLCAVTGLGVALVAAVNATNVIDPRHGFSLLVDSLGTPQPGTRMDARYQAFDAWVRSGSGHVPPGIQTLVDARMAFHAGRAIAAATFLILFVALSAYIWRTLIGRSRVRESKRWELRDATLLGSGVVAVAVCLPLLVTLVANMQGVFAPITLTLLYG